MGDSSCLFFLCPAQNDLSVPLVEEDLDGSSGLLFPFYDSDTNMLYVVGKVSAFWVSKCWSDSPLSLCCVTTIVQTEVMGAPKAHQPEDWWGGVWGCCGVRPCFLLQTSRVCCGKVRCRSPHSNLGVNIYMGGAYVPDLAWLLGPYVLLRTSCWIAEPGSCSFPLCLGWWKYTVLWDKPWEAISELPDGISFSFTTERNWWVSPCMSNTTFRGTGCSLPFGTLPQDFQHWTPVAIVSLQCTASWFYCHNLFKNHFMKRKCDITCDITCQVCSVLVTLFPVHEKE